MWSNIKYPPLIVIVCCLAPWVGILVGIGIFLVGIFKYKNVWYSMIGIVGAVFSMLIGVKLSYNLMHDEEVQNSFQYLSQQNLNEIAAKLEIYKIKNGNYPDSIEQLLNLDKFLFIKDPVQVNQKRQSTKYRYLRQKDSYILFSAGQDGIDGTYDDIFPDSLSVN